MLIVDDDPMSRHLICRQIGSEMGGSAIACEETASAVEASHLLTTTNYDLCILDYLLDDGNGLEILKEIRHAGATTPVIVVTGQGDEKTAVAALKAGASDYLVKGQFSGGDLRSSVCHALESYQRDREHHRISEQHQRTESLWKQTFHAGPIPMVISTFNEGRFIDVNDSFLKLMGYRREEVIGRTGLELGFWTGPEQRTKMVKTLIAAGRVQDMEFRLRTHSGEIRETLSSGSILEIQGQPYMLILLHDLTERRSAEAQVKSLHADLEQRVRERTLQLDLAREEIEEFAYSVAHDLRGQLRGIAGFSQILVEDYSPILGEEGRGYLHRVSAATIRLGELMDALLNLTRLSRKHPACQALDLTLLAREIAVELQSRDPKHQVQFRIQDKMEVQGDPHLLRILLHQLLENAWKFSHKSRSPAGPTFHAARAW